ncbi:hypothetical protein RB595_004169 [Gaeumannomyces hyphopodioides]
MANPFAFRPAQVTFWTTVVYLALLIPLVLINEGVPPVNPDGSLFLDRGLNITEAWADLQEITRYFHHQNSRKNDDVRDYLLRRMEQIVHENEAQGQTTIFNDLSSNLTFKHYGIPVHYQGNNLYIYIRGQDDVEGEWWHDATAGKPVGKGGVLVNAHFDSVATAYGATDDGMGVATVLQMIRYFTTRGNQPRRGIVALLNNAEEPGLLGAAAFGQSPLLPFIHTFLNLEGAGAGGRCVLFRTTDQEVTSAFANVQSPFGSVIGSDGFKLGLIRSGTDYSVWHDIFGQRGLDLSFYRPRALYHTNQDDARHANRRSLWQMMANSATTLINLSAETGSDYIGERPDGAKDKVPNGSPSDGVWFDLFGSSLVLFSLRGMFAWSLTILIVGPLTLFLMFYLVHTKDKGYIFSSKLASPGDGPDGAESIQLGGWKGLFRFPVALAVSGALVIGSALLLKKMNPFIIYSSEYAVWAMMMSLFYFAFWAMMRGASIMRPSALHRLYTHLWLFFLGWIALVAVTVLEDRMQIASGYMFVFWESQVFLSTFLAVCDLFSLPKKADIARGFEEEDHIRDHLDAVPHADDLISPSPGEAASQREEGRGQGDSEEEDQEPATEETPLFRKSQSGRLDTSLFRRGYRRSLSAIIETSKAGQDGEQIRQHQEPYGKEQFWSGEMVSSTWLLQFLLLGPFLIILAAQIGLLLTSAMNQTGVDGSNQLTPFLAVATLSIVLLVPLSPFIHRVSKHLPLLLLAVFAGTLVYNLTAFPFSPMAPYKIFFKQTVDLETGATAVRVSGIERYLRSIIADIPSAAGQAIECGPSISRRDLADCVFDAAKVPPRPAYGSGNDSLELAPGAPPTTDYYRRLLSVRITNRSYVTAGKRVGRTSARLHIDAVNTRIVELRLPAEGPAIRSVSVVGAEPWDARFGTFPEEGARLVRLWRRDWDRGWAVDLTWDGDRGLDGDVVALWSDANEAAHSMPAFREVVNYAPPWVAVSKASPGLVEGKKAFRI